MIKSAIHNLNLNFVTESSGNKKLRVSEITGFKIINHKANANNFTPGSTLACIGHPITRKYLLDLVKASISKFTIASTFRIMDGFAETQNTLVKMFSEYRSGIKTRLL